MRYRIATVATVLTAMVGWSGPCLAGGGAIGCNNLPEYERAVGTLENGEYSCGMSTAEAQRIIAAHDGQVAPPPSRRRER